jgi:hypothetical protein
MPRALFIAKEIPMSNGTLFVGLVIVSFIIFATQAGAQESKFLRSPLTCILFLVVMGGILWAIWGGHMAVFK